MTRYVFDKVEVYGEKSGPCVECGTIRRRQTRLWQTESPFNKDKYGLPKTREEIQRDIINRELPAWKARPIICKSCAETTLWEVRYRAGTWTVRHTYDHGAIGTSLWEPKYDSGYVIVHAKTEEDARHTGIEQLTAIMDDAP